MLVLNDKIPLGINNFKIEEKFGNGEKNMSFSVPVVNLTDIAEEDSIEYQGVDRYVVKSIEEGNGIATVTCRLNLDDFRIVGIYDYYAIESLSVLLERCLLGTGWKAVGADKITNTAVNELESGNMYDLIVNAQANYGVVFDYDTLNKVINVRTLESYVHKGTYFTDELNLNNLSVRRDSFDLCTRLIPIGANGLTIESANNGANYIDNHAYTSKIITKVWRNENYTTAQKLKMQELNI